MLDGRCIFRGEIAKAAGILTGGNQTEQALRSLCYFCVLLLITAFFLALLSLQGWTNLVTLSCSLLMMTSWRLCLAMMKPSSVRVRVRRAWFMRRSFRDHEPLTEKGKKDPSLRLVSERKTSW